MQGGQSLEFRRAVADAVAIPDDRRRHRPRFRLGVLLRRGLGAHAARPAVPVTVVRRRDRDPVLDAAADLHFSGRARRQHDRVERGGDLRGGRALVSRRCHAADLRGQSRARPGDHRNARESRAAVRGRACLRDAGRAVAARPVRWPGGDRRRGGAADRDARRGRRRAGAPGTYCCRSSPPPSAGSSSPSASSASRSGRARSPPRW
jgi:hypothetical protein